MTERWVFINGIFSLEEQTAIPITDRGFLFGDGIFTSMRVHQGQCELMKAHQVRLQRQAEGLKFDLPSLPFDWLSELIQRNQAWEGTWRLKVIITVKYKREDRVVGQLLATLHPDQPRPSEGSRLCLFPYPIENPLAHIKSLSYLDHLYVREYAHQRGYEDAITRTANGILLETGSSNLFWIDQEKCWVPDYQLPYLKGIFLQSLLPHLSLPVRFVKATIEQLPSSASVYTCNALTHVRPVLSIDQNEFVRQLHWEKLLQQATAQALKADAACLNVFL